MENYLFIAEKPDLGKAIAKNLEGKQEFKDGYIVVGNNIVTWGFGHILELASPDEYKDEYKIWNITDLPLDIDVNNFIFNPIKSSEKQLNVILELIQRNDIEVIINSGDNDDEGQILIDEILNYSKTDKKCERLLVSDMTSKGVTKALANIKSNDDFKGISERGFARSQADYLLGINLTRAFTILAQKKGYDGVVSVGRVQTPMLSLVVNRDNEIASHKSSFYYNVSADILLENGKSLITKLKIKDKILEELEAEEFKKLIDTNCKMEVSSVEKTEKQILPYNLLDLQADCSSLFGLKPDRTLEITQDLREKHKLITYNRSDCSYLPTAFLDDAPEILESIKNNLDNFNDIIDNADLTIVSHAFNDKNITAHHGIIPTDNKVKTSDLSKDELNVYSLLAKNFVAQFYKERKFIHTDIEIIFENDVFITSSNKTIENGFKDLFKVKENEDKEENEDLSYLVSNDSIKCKDILVDKVKTKPKALYTMKTFLKDLKNVAKYIKDENTRKLLVEKDADKKGENGGIGTPATRSTHIKNLFDRGFIEEVNKKIVSTDIGKKIISLSPDCLVTPEMTALWFEQQKEIEKGTLTKESFLNSINQQIAEEIEKAKISEKFNILIDENAVKCPNCKIGILLKKKSFKDKKTYWACSEYKDDCKSTFPDKKGVPNLEKKEVVLSKHKCPDCGKALIQRKSVKKIKGKIQKTIWYGCSDYPNCKSTFFDKKGVPNFNKK